MLLQAYRAGDVRAFERLVSRHEKPIWNFIRRFVADAATAEDLLQEVFLRVVKSADEWRGAAKFSTWLYTIARNLTVDHARRAVHRNAASLDAERSIGSGESTTTLHDRIASTDRRADEIASDRETKRRIDEAVAALPRRSAGGVSDARGDGDAVRGDRGGGRRVGTDGEEPNAVCAGEAARRSGRAGWRTAERGRIFGVRITVMATNCEDVSAQMMELLYGELPADARASVNAHVAGCARCRTELAGFEKTRAVARRGLDEAPPARAHAAIMQAAAAHLAAQAQPAARKAPVPDKVSFWDRVWVRWAFPTLATVGAVAVFMVANRVFLNPERTLDGTRRRGAARRRR